MTSSPSGGGGPPGAGVNVGRSPWTGSGAGGRGRFGLPGTRRAGRRIVHRPPALVAERGAIRQLVAAMRAVEHVHLETGESEVTVGSAAPTSRRPGRPRCHGVAVRWVGSVPIHTVLITPSGVPHGTSVELSAPSASSQRAMGRGPVRVPVGLDDHLASRRRTPRSRHPSP